MDISTVDPSVENFTLETFTYNWTSNMTKAANNGSSGSGSVVNKTNMIIFTVIEIVLMIIIIFGNGLTIIAVFRSEKLKSKTNQFVVSLAVADLCVGLVMPLHAAYFVAFELHVQKFPCLFRYSSLLMPASASIISLFMISIDRYIAIIYPLHYHTKMPQLVINGMTTFIWAYAILVGFMPFVWNHWEAAQYCIFTWVIPNIYIYTIVTPQYVIISGGMIVLYSRIFMVAARHSKALKMPQLGGPQDQQKTQQQTSDTKAARILALVMGVFLFCWTPFFVMVTLQVSGYNNPLLVTLSTISSFLTIANSGMNPIIYGWKNKDFRDAYKSILCGNRRAVGQDPSMSLSTQVTGVPANP